MMMTRHIPFRLFATKITPATKLIPANPNAVLNECYSNSVKNCKGLIPLQEAGWNEVLFRFATYENKDSRTGNSAALTYLLFRRSESNNNNFPTMLQQGHRNKGDPGGVKVCGWYKATKDRTNGARTSSSDHCINLLHWNNGGTISERHQGSSGGSDQWIVSGAAFDCSFHARARAHTEREEKKRKSLFLSLSRSLPHSRLLVPCCSYT